jgi:hypothetical protein
MLEWVEDNLTQHVPDASCEGFHVLKQDAYDDA